MGVILIYLAIFYIILMIGLEYPPCTYTFWASIGLTVFGVLWLLLIFFSPKIIASIVRDDQYAVIFYKFAQIHTLSIVIEAQHIWIEPHFAST